MMPSAATSTPEPQSEFGMERDPFANEYGNYNAGFDQWQLWAQRSRTRPRRGRSLLSDMVDPRVQRHMMLSSSDTPPKKQAAKCPAAPAVMRRRATGKLHARAGTAEFCPTSKVASIKKEASYKKEPPSVCSSTTTKATSESDDSSYSVVYPPAAAVTNAAWWERDNEDLMSHSMVLEQQAMLHAMEMKQQQQSTCRDNEALPSRLPHRGTDKVKILPSHRVKRAMERGESIRLLTCSGCACELLVTTDLPLVYCTHCESFSHLRPR